MEQNLVERLAVLESKVESFQKSQDDILAEVKSINSTLGRYKGFFGGIIFVVSALWAFIDLTKGWLVNHIK